MIDFLPVLILLMVIAALLREDTVLTIFYLLAGAYLITRLWIGRAMAGVTFRRHFSNRAFLGETIPVEVELKNTSLLPLVWLEMYESLPSELATPGFQRRVISLGGHSRVGIRYLLQARKRGYYNIGPLYLTSGDLFGLTGETNREGSIDHFTVYPKIIPFARVGLPSQFPFGTLKHHQPMFEDPARPFGKRDYRCGDSLRRVDWKATAVLNRLQVKLFEASIALETVLFLNLNSDEYDLHTRFAVTELAITIAASLANWVIGQKQTSGLVCNGLDPLSTAAGPTVIQVRKGRSHLMHILDILARIQAASTSPFTQMIRDQAPLLTWGATLVLITGLLTPALADEILQARRYGLNPVLVLAGPGPIPADTRRKLQHFGVPIYPISDEKALDIWRN